MTDPGVASLPTIPRDDDGLVFRAPWEAQAFAMAVLLHERGVFTWVNLRELEESPGGKAAVGVLIVGGCWTPPSYGVGSFDAQPGLSKNPVKISSTSPTLVILVKGSATLDVTKIATAKVGNASPVVSGVFSVLSKPADLTRDGRKDRLYFFRPSQTGLTCSSTSVTIGGTLTGGALWSGTDAIKAVC